MNHTQAIINRIKLISSDHDIRPDSIRVGLYSDECYIDFDFNNRYHANFEDTDIAVIDIANQVLSGEQKVYVNGYCRS